MNLMQKENLMESKDIPPYNIVSEVRFNLIERTSYDKFVKRYDPELYNLIAPLDTNLMNQALFLINCDMQPDNKQWMLWKNSDQIMEFIMNFDNQMEEMMAIKERQSNNSRSLNQTYNNLKTMQAGGPQFIDTFIKWLNLIGSQPYLRKTEDYMIFIEHCVPIDKWHMKIYQQMNINKAPTLKNKIFGLFSQQAKKEKTRDYFCTITSQGILKSDNHLLQSRISHMIPFTNQMDINTTKDADNFISFEIKSCSHEALIFSFYDDYVRAVNFGCALRKALEQSSYNKPHRFKSFCQKRENCDSKLYHCGFQYYDDLYEQISRAKFQICMTGWMITPYFLLRRPGPITDKTYRLDGALQAAAKRGVRVFVIVFMQPKGFVNNDSEHVQDVFEGLHRNIQVVRHPNGAIPLLWSHHEKMVVIDQRVGFMGGLDICYGRWDTPDHFMFDPSQLWDGCEFNNYRTKDVYTPRLYKQCALNQSFQPRMPWQDIAIQVRGDSVIDMLRHFVQYWYFVKQELEFDSVKFLENTKKRFTEAINHEDVQVRKQVKDYMNYLKSQEEPVEGKFDKMKNKFKVLISGEQIIINQLFIDRRPGSKVGNETHQLCRSASTWSIGVRDGNHEQSIHNAYQELIDQSKGFIYIENQFFMGLENKIVDKLAERISRAHAQKQPFKCIVVMPLLPGFEGDITDPNSTVLRIQMHHQYQSIKRGKKALFKQLAHINNIDDYIFFFGLRQSCVIEGTPVTQIIYVHSKLMIVDDERFIIGSANINDRSLLGCRDSELAMIVDERQGGGKAFNLRARLFQSHFSLTEEESKNIMQQQVWNKVIKNAQNNTLIFRQVFGCIPDDTCSTSAEVPQLEKKANIHKYAELRHKIIGHATVFPHDFMKDEDLTFKPNQKEFFVPESSFT